MSSPMDETEKRAFRAMFLERTAKVVVVLLVWIGGLFFCLNLLDGQ